MGCIKTGKPGQGATEYLVLLAVVLIVALVSVSLLGFFPGMSSDTQLKQSQAYWSGTARPFQVLDEASTYGTLCGADNSGGYMLSMQNTEASSLKITNISVDGSSGFCGPTGALNAPVSLGAGEKKTLTVITSASAAPCTEGKAAQMGLNITYSTTYLTNKVQSGAKKLLLRCSTPAVAVTLPSCSNESQDCSTTSCCASLHCNTNDNLCYSCLPDGGATCGSNSDCCSGLTCNDGTCGVACVQEGDSCDALLIGGATCCSGLVCQCPPMEACSTGTCTVPAACLARGKACDPRSPPACCNVPCSAITLRCP